MRPLGRGENCQQVKILKITEANCNFTREPLAVPFGFKGGYLTGLWQVVVRLADENGNYGVGLGVQSVLWSDAEVFAANPEAVGNSMMFMVTAFAAKKARGLHWETPLDLLEQLLPDCLEYARTVTGNQDLRLTFVLNALVPVDNAAWQLYAHANNFSSFDEMIPAELAAPMSERHRYLACVPLISYKVDAAAIAAIVENGSFFLKVKIGCDPDGDGDRDKMLAWDKRRLAEVHDAVKNMRTSYTESGRIPYYLDANGRYDSVARLREFLEYAESIGALERIVIMEEPFAEDADFDVHDLPVCLAADESAHSDSDTLARIAQGYRAVALKPIAKTLSMSLKIAKVAHEHGVPCFCADLTVNPVLVDWNKNVAARLGLLPGMKVGILESNGGQNYRNWCEMKKYHPCGANSWLDAVAGVFELDDDFYRQSGGILLDSEYYSGLV